MKIILIILALGLAGCAGTKKIYIPEGQCEPVEGGQVCEVEA